MAKVADSADRDQPEIMEWIDEELCRERSHLESLPGEARRTVGAGMSLGAKEVLERLQRYMRGDDKA